METLTQNGKSYKILVVSDSHRDQYTLEKIIKKEADANLIIHLGDGIDEFEDLMLYTRKNNISVKGNSDTDSISHSDIKTVTVCDKKLFLSHGHIFNVKDKYDDIIKNARAENADLCLFGHTHMQHISTVDGMTVLNPGAVYSLQQYAVIKITDGNIHAELKCLKGNA